MIHIRIEYDGLGVAVFVELAVQSIFAIRVVSVQLLNSLEEISQLPTACELPSVV